MPTYDYVCSACKEKTEAFQKMSDSKLTTCPKCHQETLVRKPSGGIGLSFNGDGFYSTMYGDKKSAQESCGGGCACHPSKKG